VEPVGAEVVLVELVETPVPLEIRAMLELLVIRGIRAITEPAASALEEAPVVAAIARMMQLLVTLQQTKLF
jgi:hypothetical protein